MLAVTKESVFEIIILFHHIEKWIKFNISCEKVVTKTCFWKEMKRHAFDTANMILSCPLFYWIYYNLIWWLWLLSCVIHSRTLLNLSFRKSLPTHTVLVNVVVIVWRKSKIVEYACPKLQNTAIPYFMFSIESRHVSNVTRRVWYSWNLVQCLKRHIYL